MRTAWTGTVWVRRVLLGFGAVGLAAVPAWSCGPDFPSAVFVLPHGPGGDYAAYAKGRLGVPQTEYFTRNLVVAFDWMTGRGLNADEQKQAVATDKFLSGGESADEDAKKEATGFAAWTAARGKFGAVAGEPATPELTTDRTMPGEDYESFANCLDDAFANAARTLAARVAAHGGSDASVREWVLGQDAVFSNCGDGKAPRYFGDPSKAPQAPPQARMPNAAKADAPLWLRQDRAYQMAAANFYALRYEDAAKGFGAIASDAASPWAGVAPYLVARVHLRQATIAAAEPFDETDAARAKAPERASARHAALGKAHAEFAALAGHDGPMREAAASLQDFVDARYMPDQQAVVLAERLHGAVPRKDFGQALIDLTYLRTNQSDASQPLAAHGPRHDTAGMLEWMDAMALDKGSAPYDRWKKERTEVWLVAAMNAVPANDPVVPELLRAAAEVKPDSKAYLAVTYWRLQLMKPDAAMRAQLEAVLPRVRSGETISTLNLFLALDAKSATGLKAWLAAAGRAEVGEADSNGVTATSGVSTDDAVGVRTPPLENVCGSVVKPASVQLFDDDAAYALNHDFPLTRLAEAAESGVLPANLQFQVAQAAWARAVMLDRADVAARMTPLLTACRSAWKTVLGPYDAAKTADDRKALGLLALMRFASTEPSVRFGEERRSGFATYDEYRQNWWCTTVPPAGKDVDYGAWQSREGDKTDAAPPAPAFLTAADRAAAKQEVAALQAVPSASSYLGNAALTWWRAHPKDPRTLELLGQSFRVVRNSCRDDKRTPPLAHAIFDALHKDFPQSEWAKKYTTWE